MRSHTTWTNAVADEFIRYQYETVFANNTNIYFYFIELTYMYMVKIKHQNKVNWNI